MFSLILFLASVILSTSQIEASPAPASTAGVDLPVIGHARSRTYCDREAARTAGAITVTLTNDKVVSAGINELRSVNLDNPDMTIIQREKKMRDLRQIPIALLNNAKAGAAQVADLRWLAKREPDQRRSAELGTFADSIESAMDVQQQIGRDFAKMLTIIDGRYARAQSVTDGKGILPDSVADQSRDGVSSIDRRAEHEPIDQLFSDVADDFGERVSIISKAEDAAALHAPNAIAGCQN